MSFEAAADYFSVACRKKIVASVATRTQGDWQVFRSRLLRCDPRAAKLTLEYPTPVSGGRDVLFSCGQSLAIKFVANDHRLLFLGNIEVVHTQPCRILPVRAIEVSVPDKLTCINQRRFFRVDIPQEQPLELEVWETGMQRLLKRDDEPCIFRGRALNVSIGGLLASEFEGKPGWVSGNHLGIKIIFPEDVARSVADTNRNLDTSRAKDILYDEAEPLERALLLNAEVRHAWHDKEHGLCFGVAFLGAETLKKTISAQERLARLVAEYQRRWLGRRVG
ncbi:MAG: hypothetical protein E4H17_03370 [Gemmatimonadales bacterium]|nr:MAG: hypothetical protein E4H17_03370 [Gemmatimonadales bacterium]